MHDSRPPLSQDRSAGARMRATVTMTASRQPVRRTSVPRSVVFPAQRRFLCVTERPGLARECPKSQGFRESPAASDVYTPPSIAGLPTAKPPRADGKGAAGVVGTITPALRSGLQLVTRAPEPFSVPRRTIFCAGPMAELCVVADAGRRDSLTGFGAGMKQGQMFLVGVLNSSPRSSSQPASPLWDEPSPWRGPRSGFRSLKSISSISGLRPPLSKPARGEVDSRH